VNTKPDLTIANAEATRECPNCGSSNVTYREDTEAFRFGEDPGAITLAAHVTVGACATCGFTFTDESGEQARHDAVCRHLGVMTPQEIKALRGRYGMSRSEFARVTRLGEASVARWENSLLIQNAAYDQFLYLLQFAENVRRLEHRRARVSAGESRESASTQSKPKLQILEISDALLAESKSFELRPTGTYG